VKLIDKIIKKLNILDRNSVTDDMKYIIWKYRYWLSRNPNALTTFLLSANFSTEEEESEVINLLEQWSHIQIDDALYLLSGMFSANQHYTTR
jgi:hypothetical protein